MNGCCAGSSVCKDTTSRHVTVARRAGLPIIVTFHFGDDLAESQSELFVRERSSSLAMREGWQQALASACAVRRDF